MYDSLCRRGGSNRIVGAHVRQVPIDANLGDRREFLRRHERAARAAAQGTQRQRQAFAAGLRSRVADPRNVMCAIDHLVADGVKAPGPSGLRLEQLAGPERWKFAKVISQELRSGLWPTGSSRLTAIPKTSGTGCRPIEVANAEDRIAQRACAQILQPLLEPRFDERSFAFRRGLGRQDALAEAHAWATQHGTSVFVKDDVRNAFTNVSHNRLLDVLRHHGLDEPMVSLIQQLIGNSRGRGIPQGGCLCPLLLNVYLDWFLDRAWRRLHPNAPLIRYADDLLILCPPGSNGQAEYADLTRITRSAGMPLKGTPEGSIVNLGQGGQIDWLGYSVTMDGADLVAQISESSYTRLRYQLEQLHDKPDASVRAWELALGWVEQMAPCYDQQGAAQVYERVVAIAAAYAFEEVPGFTEFQDAWQRAAARYYAIQRTGLLRAKGQTSGRSASRYQTSAHSGRGNGVLDTDTPLPPFSDSTPDVTLYADGCCLGSSGPGGWAFSLAGGEFNDRVCGSDSYARTTRNRMELLAVIKGIESLEDASRVLVVTHSEYVYHGLTQRLPQWRQNRWRRRSGGQLANAGLWQRLEQVIAPHAVRCQWVRSQRRQLVNDDHHTIAEEAAPLT